MQVLKWIVYKAITCSIVINSTAKESKKTKAERAIEGITKHLCEMQEEVDKCSESGRMSGGRLKEIEIKERRHQEDR